MKFKDKEEMKDDIESLGLAALSKFSAINHLSKLSIPLSGMIAIESMVREIECGLWTLVPLGLNGDEGVFNSHIEHLTKKFESVIAAAKAMKFCKDSL